jgi:hypothetical protein
MSTIEASGNALHWVLLCLGQHTLLGIVVGFCGASGNTLLLILGFVNQHVPRSTPYWVLRLVHVGHRATHFTGYCWFM